MLATVAGFTHARSALQHRLSFATFRYGTRDNLRYPASTTNRVFIRGQASHTNPSHSSTEAQLQSQKNLPVYRNRRGEELSFDPNNPPSNHVFVPTGNHFITQRCRMLTQNPTVVLKRDTGNDPFFRRLGYFIPMDISANVQREFETRRAEAERDLWNMISRRYPGIFPDVKEKFYLHILRKKEGCVGETTLDPSKARALNFILNHYTSYRRIVHCRDKKKSAETGGKARKLTEFWPSGVEKIRIRAWIRTCRPKSRKGTDGGY